MSCVLDKTPINVSEFRKREGGEAYSSGVVNFKGFTATMYHLWQHP